MSTTQAPAAIGEAEVRWDFSVPEYVGDIEDLARMSEYIGDAHTFATTGEDHELAVDVSWDEETIIVSIPATMEQLIPFLNAIKGHRYFDELRLDLPADLDEAVARRIAETYAVETVDWGGVSLRA